MLTSETFAAALMLTGFRGLACALVIQARAPSSARVPGVALPRSIGLNFSLKLLYALRAVGLNLDSQSDTIKKFLQ